MCKTKSAVHARKGVASVQPVKACDQRGRQVFSVTRSKKIAHKRAWPLRNRRAKGTIQKNPYWRVVSALVEPSRTRYVCRWRVLDAGKGRLKPTFFRQFPTANVSERATIGFQA